MKKSVNIVVITLCFFSALATADEKWYVGVTDESDENLLAVCKEYLGTSFKKDTPDYYLRLIPPSMKKREKKIIKSFHKRHAKIFGSKEKKFTILEFKPIERFNFRGRDVARVAFDFKTEAMKYKSSSSCDFEKNENQAWYFSRTP